MNSDVIHQKRQLYDKVYTSLTNVQRSYGSISQHLSKYIGVTIPKTPEDVAMLDAAHRNILIANDSITRVEDVKFICGLALLSDGALVGNEEVAIVIESLDELIFMADKEQEIGDIIVAEWAATKAKSFSEVKKVLLELLNYKLKRQTHFNKTELQ